MRGLCVIYTPKQLQVRLKQGYSLGNDINNNSRNIKLQGLNNLSFITLFFRTYHVARD